MDVRFLKWLRSILVIALVLSAPIDVASAQGIARTSNQPLASTLNSAIAVQLMEGQSVASFYVSGLTAAAATLTIEGSADGKNPSDATKSWFPISALPASCPATSFSTMSADGVARVDTAALTDVRVRVSSAGNGGTIRVSFAAIPGATLSLAACGGGGSVTFPSYTYDVSNATKAPQYCSITVTTTATPLSSLLSTAGCAAIPSWASVVYLLPETTTLYALRWRADGTAPSNCSPGGVSGCQPGYPVFGNTSDPGILGQPAAVGASLIAPAATVTDVRIGG